MPEKKLPVFPDELTPLGPSLSVGKCGRHILYVDPLGVPLYTHPENDLPGFWVGICQFYTFGTIIKQSDITRVFEVSTASIRRAVQVFLKHGLAGFYAPGQVDESATSGAPRSVASMRRTVKEMAAEHRQMRQGSAEPPPIPAGVLTWAILVEAQKLLNQGLEAPDVARRLGVRQLVLKRAIQDGRLLGPEKREDSIPE